MPQGRGEAAGQEPAEQDVCGTWGGIDPHKLSTLIDLSGEDICCEMVPMEEPLMPEHVQHIEHGGTVLQLLGGWGEACCCRGEHCGHMSPFDGSRCSGRSTEGGRQEGWMTGKSGQHGGMVVVRKQEAEDVTIYK